MFDICFYHKEKREAEARKTRLLHTLPAQSALTKDQGGGNLKVVLDDKNEPQNHNDDPKKNQP